MGNRKELEDIIKLAVEAGRISAERSAKDAYKATERRLYALPILRRKLADDKERLEEIRQYGPRERSKSITRFTKSGVRLSPEEIFEAVVMDMEATIAADQYEIDTMDKALSVIQDDEYYLTVTGRYLDDLPDERVAEIIPMRHEHRLEEPEAPGAAPCGVALRGRRHEVGGVQFTGAKIVQ